MNSEELTNIGKQVVKKRGTNGHFPQMIPEPKTPEERNEIGEKIAKLLPLYQAPKVKSDEELEQRFVEYFNYCSTQDIRPTVEGMAMAVGYAFRSLYDIEVGRSKGFSSETSNIIKKAKAFLAVYDADLVASGKMNPVTYIFRAKNYYGMSDKQEVVVTPNTPLGNGENVEAIEQSYADSIVDDE